MGRYYAMDRDHRWDRTHSAYRAILFGDGVRHASSIEEAVISSYQNGSTDEFIEPHTLGNYKGVASGDAFIMCNFRADRVRQLLSLCVDDRQATSALWSYQIGMVGYSSELSQKIHTLYPSDSLSDTLGSVISQEGIRQLRVAETEKYAHITFFFNGGREEPYSGESRILIPSPKVNTYDLLPEMSAVSVTDACEDALLNEHYPFLVVNYANADMVGHTGMFDATVHAVECLDRCVARLKHLIQSQHGTLVVTSDHGNAEMMVESTSGEPHTAHTIGPVPFLIWGKGANGWSGVRDGSLCDIAPTLLTMMGMNIPNVMTGQNLLYS